MDQTRIHPSNYDKVYEPAPPEVIGREEREEEVVDQSDAGSTTVAKEEKVEEGGTSESKDSVLYVQLYGATNISNLALRN